MNETTITIRGWVGGAPRLFENTRDGESGKTYPQSSLSMRVGVTPRYYSRRAGEYEDGTTTWYTVRCYGMLARNVLESVHRGYPVLVRGRLTSRTYSDSAGVERTEQVILADSVGIELATGISNFVKRSSVPNVAIPGEPQRGITESSQLSPQSTQDPADYGAEEPTEEMCEEESYLA